VEQFHTLPALPGIVCIYMVYMQWFLYPCPKQFKKY
jgi:hypothetical protein